MSAVTAVATPSATSERGRLHAVLVRLFRVRGAVAAAGSRSSSRRRGRAGRSRRESSAARASAARGRRGSRAPTARRRASTATTHEPELQHERAPVETRARPARRASRGRARAGCSRRRCPRASRGRRSGSPLLIAKSAMISSGALPKLALRKPPMPGPVCSPACSVASPISHASGISAAAASTNSSDVAGVEDVPRDERDRARARAIPRGASAPRGKPNRRRYRPALPAVVRLVKACVASDRVSTITPDGNARAHPPSCPCGRRTRSSAGVARSTATRSSIRPRASRRAARSSTRSRSSDTATSAACRTCSTSRSTSTCSPQRSERAAASARSRRCVSRCRCARRASTRATRIAPRRARVRQSRVPRAARRRADVQGSSRDPPSLQLDERP